MSTCNYTTTILDTDCIGDSRVVINNNFSALDTTVCTQQSLITSLQSQINSLSAAMASPKSIAKAWINFNGVNLTINSSYNIATVTRIPGKASGAYRVTFTNALADSNYCIIGNPSDLNANVDAAQTWTIYRNYNMPKTTLTFDFYVVWNNTVPAGGVRNSTEISLAIFGN